MEFSFWAFVFLFYLVVDGAEVAVSDCFSRLRTHAAEFEICKTQLCLMFIDEGPYAIATKKMVAENIQTLFKCQEKAAFPGLHGISFSIMDRMKEMDDVYCVYAGNNCKFGDMIDLASTYPSRYRLGVDSAATHTTKLDPVASPS